MKRGAGSTFPELADKLGLLRLLNLFSLPKHPGVAVFFVSLALSHHWYDILSEADYGDLAAETIEAVALGLLATAAGVAAIRRLRPDDCEAILARLSLTLLPGILFLFAPFRSAQVCRWTGYCDLWTDLFMLAGASLCIVVGIFVWSVDTKRWTGTAPGSGGLGRLRTALGSRLYPVTWLACTALLVWRGQDRLLHPELWAEGSRPFVSDALNLGWISLLEPHHGYYHTVPRLVALLATSLAPVTHIPTFTMTTCFLIAGAIPAFLVRPSFRWLIPSDGARFLGALLLCLVPALQGMLGGLPPLHYYLFVLLGLLILKDPSMPYRAWELVVALLIVFSSGMVAALAPAAFGRAWLLFHNDRGEGRLRRRTRDIVLLLLIVAPSLFMGLAVLTAGQTEAGVAGLNPAMLVEAYTTVINAFLLLHPFAGTIAATEMLYTIPETMLAVATLSVLAALFHRHRASGHTLQAGLVAVWLSGPLFLIALLALLRHPDLSMYRLEGLWRHLGWWMRYYYVFAATGVLLWLFLLRPTQLVPGRSAGNVAALTLCVAYASQANWYFDAERYGRERYWRQTSAELQRSVETGCPRSVTVKAYPEPERWGFTYYAHVENQQCKPDN